MDGALCTPRAELANCEQSEYLVCAQFQTAISTPCLRRSAPVYFQGCVASRLAPSPEVPSVALGGQPAQVGAPTAILENPGAKSEPKPLWIASRRETPHRAQRAQGHPCASALKAQGPKQHPPSARCGVWLEAEIVERSGYTANDQPTATQGSCSGHQEEQSARFEGESLPPGGMHGGTYRDPQKAQLGLA